MMSTLEQLLKYYYSFIFKLCFSHSHMYLQQNVDAHPLT